VKCAVPALSTRRNARPDRSLTKLRARLVAKDSLTETTLPLTSKGRRGHPGQDCAQSATASQRMRDVSLSWSCRWARCASCALPGDDERVVAVACRRSDGPDCLVRHTRLPTTRSRVFIAPMQNSRLDPDALKT